VTWAGSVVPALASSNTYRLTRGRPMLTGFAALIPRQVYGYGVEEWAVCSWSTSPALLSLTSKKQNHACSKQQRLGWLSHGCGLWAEEQPGADAAAARMAAAAASGGIPAGAAAHAAAAEPRCRGSQPAAWWVAGARKHARVQVQACKRGDQVSQPRPSQRGLKCSSVHWCACACAWGGAP